MLAIVLSIFTAASRPQPAPTTVALDDSAVRRVRAPQFNPAIPTNDRGGTEVLAFEV